MTFDLAASLDARHRQSWCGMVKTQEDVRRYEHVIGQVRPSLIVEVGTFSGKSALWFAQHAPVLTCDVTPNIDPATEAVFDKQAHPIRLHVGLSTAVPFAQAVAEEMRAFPGPMLLSLDGAHDTAIVAAELALYADLAAYVVVEDTLVRWFPEQDRVGIVGDPLEAVEGWLADHPEWEPDVDTESMFPVSQFPGGWLQRKATL